MAQSVFKGIVVTSENNDPLPGVTVSVDKQTGLTTDDSGTFEFSSNYDKVTIIFSHVGYQSQSGVYAAGNPIHIILNRSNAFLAETIVKAFERNGALKSMPASVAILSRADLERYSNTSLLQAVNTVPGVKMDERSPGSYRLSIRGNVLRSPFGVRNVKMYWNGIPFTDANGNTYLNQLGFNNIGKIEIIKGPGGSMYGAGTGGVVLLSSSIPADMENSILFNSTGGSYGLFGTDLAYRHGTKNAHYTLSYGHQQADGWRTHTNMCRDAANYTGSFDINKKQSISTNIFYSDLYYQTPGGLTATQMILNSRQSRPAAGSIPGAEEQQAALFLKTFYAGFAHDYQLNARWSNTTSVYTSNTRFRNPAIRNYERKTEQGIGARTMTQYQHRNFKLNFGGEYQYSFTNTNVFGNTLGNIDTLQNNDEIDASIYSVFVQADGSLPLGLIVNAGVSYNNCRYGFVRLNQLPAVKVSRDFKPELVPRISLLKKIRERYSIYAIVGKGFSPPSIDEIHATDGIFNTVLEAEEGMNYELGIRGDIIKDKLMVDASYYFFWLHNTIIKKEISGAEHFINTGRTNERGLELAVNYYPLKAAKGFFETVRVWSNYTHLYARFKEYKQGSSDSSGNKLTGTAPDVLVAGLDVKTRPGLYFNVTYNYTAEIPLNDANTFFSRSYNLLSGRIGYKKNISKSIHSEIYFSFDRSFNNPYSLGNDLNATGNRFFNPSAPENYFGGIKLQFNF